MVEANQKTAVVKKGKRKSSQKKAASRGGAKMNKAADEALSKNSAEIAESLVKSTLGGNVQSARLLMELAERTARNGAAEKPSRVHSAASELAAEPEWAGEVGGSTDEAHTETHAGNRTTDEKRGLLLIAATTDKE